MRTEVENKHSAEDIMETGTTQQMVYYNLEEQSSAARTTWKYHCNNGGTIWVAKYIRKL